MKKASEAELLSRIVEKLQVSEPVARSLLLESRTLFQSYDLGDRVFTVSCGGDPAKAYGRQMQMRLLFQRIGEVLSPRELNLVRCYLGIGQPEEQGMTFQELAVRLNYNGPSGEGIQACHPETETTPPRRSLRPVAGHPASTSGDAERCRAGDRLLHTAEDLERTEAILMR